MRSLAATFLLALLATALCGLAGWQWRQGNFDLLFGAPPTAVGQRLYTSFRADQVKHLRISDHGTSAAFSLLENGWQASVPWEDRMDPRAAVAIINFALGLRVEDYVESQRMNPQRSGLNENGIVIRLEDANHAPLANFKLGRVTPWKAEVEGVEQPVATVYVHPRDPYHKRYVYACTGDITPLFKDGLKLLRDHRPFYFNPTTLCKIAIDSPQGGLTLGRESPQASWRIVKPLDLATNPAAIKSLLEGIYELRATELSDKASGTLPALDDTVKTNRIALTSFGSDHETVLEIYPPESRDARNVKAVVSNRPHTVFDLPLKPGPGLVSLADLPLAVNDLRDPTLTHLNIAALRAISIEPATGSPILITRQPPQPWQATINGQACEANEENLYTLLKALTSHRVTGFESDAATDFTPWGLDKPFLRLRLLGQDNQVVELRFGNDGKGGLFVNRLATPTVMRVDETLLAAITVRPYEWRHARLWSLDRVNLNAIQRQTAGEAPLLLRYQFIDESWRAERNGTDLSNALDPVQANYLLTVMEELKVARWLATTDETAAAALASPSLTLVVFEKSVDADGNFSGLAQRTLNFAPTSSSPEPNFYYGNLSSEPNPFLITRETYQKLAAKLLE